MGCFEANGAYYVFSHLGCHVWGQHSLGGVAFAWIMEGFSSTVEREREGQRQRDRKYKQKVPN